eukprot:Skav201320  [mRNA]  locus=scaffold500:32113:35833:- [translate_table: standard]
MQSHLCDVVIKSDDGREHFAHRNVLSAASKPMKNLLSGDFIEGTQMKSGQPVHIAASGNVVSAMIDHIYGGEPVISTSDAMELLRLAGAYHMTDLVSEIESASGTRGRYVTECGKIYCADAGPVGQILTFNPGERTALKVLDNAQRFWYDKPVDVLVKDTSLFVLYQSGLVYQYDLPRKIQLD